MRTEKYLFRRQFVLGPRHIESLPGWKRVEIHERLRLTVHPDLQVLEVRSGAKSITLLGYILDPHNPSFDDLRIIQNMIEDSSTFDDILRHIKPKGGRFALIVQINNDLRILNDAAGFRQIFYYRDDLDDIWCASQPSILAEQCNLRIDEDVRKDLRSLPLFTPQNAFCAHWYPGTTTLYKGVFHLTPNHYLDLNTGEVVRYWPMEQLKAISLQECVERSSETLQSLLESACNRFDLGFRITAGLDTRVLFAASKRIREKMYFLTVTNSPHSEDERDIAVPRAMLNRLGLMHHVVPLCEKASEEFERLFRRNVTDAHTQIGLVAYSFYRHLANIKRTMVVIDGECGEIGRSFYRLPSFLNISGETLATLAMMHGSRIAEREFDAWLKSVGESTSCAANILDLFYWEQRCAHWSVMCSEYDIVFESFSPYNCRELLETMLSVDRTYRLSPGYELQKQLSRRMWPETLRFPVNPPSNRKEAIANVLRGTWLYKVLRCLRFLYHRYR